MSSNIIFNKDILPDLDFHLKNYEENTRRARKLRILKTIHILEEVAGNKPLLEYKYKDFLKLSNEINSLDIRLKSKQRRMRDLKIFIQELLAYNEEFEKANYYDFIFKRFKYTDNGYKIERVAIEKEELHVFLNEMRKRNYNYYIWFRILIYSGCRWIGLKNLQFKNINYKERYFETMGKRVNGSGKSIYFLDENTMKLIEKYQKEVSRDNVCHRGYNTVLEVLQRRRKSWTLHDFRHTIRRLWHDKGITRAEADILLNHKETSIDAIYLKTLKTNADKREIYDKFFPF